MVGLVPTIQPSASSGACRTLDPRDKPEDDCLALEFRSSPIGATLICPDIHEDDRLDEAQLAAWVKQASRLPGERM